ncbi:hypothetical protein FRB95_013897 [Tulasnella sp. JGI-2019a]|nr:hypothetical protein FRB95_013897 [Tulasnella sp. JGI-2019a]
MYWPFSFVYNAVVNPFLHGSEELATSSNGAVTTSSNSSPSTSTGSFLSHTSSPTSESGATETHRTLKRARPEPAAPLTCGRSGRVGKKFKAAHHRTTASGNSKNAYRSPLAVALEDITDDDRHRGKRMRREEVPDIDILQTLHRLLPPNRSYDHLVYAQQAAISLRRRRPPPHFDSPIITPSLTHRPLNTFAQQNDDKDTAGAETEEQLLKRKQRDLFVKFLDSDSHTLKAPKRRSTLNLSNIPPPAPSSPPSSSSTYSPNKASSNPSSSQVQTPSDETKIHPDVDPAPAHVPNLEHLAKTLANMTWYLEPPSPANDNNPTICIVGVNKKVDTPIWAGSVVHQLLDFVLATYGLQIEQVPNPDTPYTAATPPAAFEATRDTSPDHTDCRSSAVERGPPPQIESTSGDLCASSESVTGSNRSLDVNELVDTSLHSASASDVAAGDVLFTSSNEVDVPEGNSVLGQGFVPNNITSAEESSSDVVSSLLVPFIAADASLDTRAGIVIEDAVNTKGGSDVKRLKYSIDDVHFARLAENPVGPSVSHPGDISFCFYGLLNKCNSHPVEARFKIRSHPRKLNAWWIVSNTPDDTHVLANLTFGFGTRMHFQADGRADIKILAFSPRYGLKRRSFTTDQETAKQLASLIQLSPTFIIIHLPKPSLQMANNNPDDVIPAIQLSVAAQAAEATHIMGTPPAAPQILHSATPSEILPFEIQQMSDHVTAVITPEVALILAPTDNMDAIPTHTVYLPANLGLEVAMVEGQPQASDPAFAGITPEDSQMEDATQGGVTIDSMGDIDTTDFPIVLDNVEQVALQVNLLMAPTEVVMMDAPVPDTDDIVMGSNQAALVNLSGDIVFHDVGVAAALIEEDEEMLPDEEDESDQGLGFDYEDEDDMDGLETEPASVSQATAEPAFAFGNVGPLTMGAANSTNAIQAPVNHSMAVLDTAVMLSSVLLRDAISPIHPVSTRVVVPTINAMAGPSSAGSRFSTPRSMAFSARPASNAFGDEDDDDDEVTDTAPVALLDADDDAGLGILEPAVDDAPVAAVPFVIPAVTPFSNQQEFEDALDDLFAGAQAEVDIAAMIGTLNGANLDRQNHLEEDGQVGEEEEEEEEEEED